MLHGKAEEEDIKETDHQRETGTKHGTFRCTVFQKGACQRHFVIFTENFSIKDKHHTEHFALGFKARKTVISKVMVFSSLDQLFFLDKLKTFVLCIALLETY